MSAEGSSSVASSSLASMRDDEEEDPNDQYLKEFADKLVNFEDLEDDACLIEESNLTELEQLTKLGITMFDTATEFDRTILVSACELGLTKALSAIIRRLKTAHGDHYLQVIDEYLSAGKELNTPELAPIMPTLSAGPKGMRIRRQVSEGPLTALHFCLAAGFLPGLRILVEEAMTEESRSFYLTFCDPRTALNQLEDGNRLTLVGHFLSKNWWSPLVFAISGNKTKCALYVLQRGAVPYWSHDKTRAASQQDFMCTALYVIVAYTNEFLFNQVMGRKFPTSPFPSEPITVTAVIPFKHRDTRLIGMTMVIGRFYKGPRNPAYEVIIGRINRLRREMDTARIDPTGERRLEGFTQSKERAERELEDLNRTEREQKAAYKRTCASMALSMVKRSGPWDYWPEYTEDGEHIVGPDGKHRSLDYAEHVLGLNLYGDNGVDYTDAFDVATHAAQTRTDSVFEFLVSDDRFPLLERDESRTDQTPYLPYGRQSLLEIVLEYGTPRMAEILIAEKGLNPFNSEFGKSIHEHVFGSSLNYPDDEDDEINFREIKGPAYVAPFVRHFLEEAMENEGRFYGKPIAQFPSTQEYAGSLNPTMTLLDLATIANDRELIIAAAAFGGDPSDSIGIAFLMDHPEAFYTLLGLGATTKGSVPMSQFLDMAKERPKIGAMSKIHPILHISNLQSMALKAVLQKSPQARKDEFTSIVKEQQEDDLKKLEAQKTAEEKELQRLIIQTRIDAIKKVLESGSYASSKFPALFLRPPLEANRPLPVLKRQSPVATKHRKSTPTKKQHTPETKTRTSPFASTSPASSVASSSTTPEARRSLFTPTSGVTAGTSSLSSTSSSSTPPPKETRKKRVLSPPYDPDYSASAQEEEKVQRTGKLIRAVFTACKNQDQKSVSTMLEQYPHLIKARLADGTTLSAYASKRGIQFNQ